MPTDILSDSDLAGGSSGATAASEITEETFATLPTTWTGGTPADFETVGSELKLTSAAATQGGEKLIWNPTYFAGDVEIDVEVTVGRGIFGILMLYNGFTDALYPYVNYNFNGSNSPLYKQTAGVFSTPLASTRTDYPTVGAKRWHRLRVIGRQLDWSVFSADPNSSPSPIPPLAPVVYTIPNNLDRVQPGAQKNFGLLLQANTDLRVSTFRVKKLS